MRSRVRFGERTALTAVAVALMFVLTGVTAAAAPGAAPSAGAGVAPAHHHGTKTVGKASWGQYQGSALHNGVAGGAGPSAATLAWTANAGEGDLGAVAIGSELLISSVINGTLQSRDLANGSVTSTSGASFQEVFPVLSSSAELYVDPYSYNCWWFGCSTGSQLVNLDPANGAGIWGFGTGTYETRWYVASEAGFAYLATPASGSLYGISMSTGAQSWADALPSYVSTTPTYGAGDVVVGYGALSEVTAVSYYTGAYKWNFTTDAPVSSPSIASQGKSIFFGTQAGTLYALKTKSGHKLWTFNDGGTAISTTPAVGLQEVVFGAGGTLYALNETTGALLWTHTVGGLIDASPVISKGNHLIYAGDANGLLFAVNSAGKAKWHAWLAGPVSDGLLLAPHLLLATTANGFVYAFGPAGTVGTFPAVANSDWGQYQGDSAHDGAGWSAGPTSPTVVFNVTAGAGPVGLTSVGNVLLASSPTNNTIYQINLDNGTRIGSFVTTMDDLFPVQSLDGMDFAAFTTYSYNCWWFGCSTGSQLASYSYASQTPSYSGNWGAGLSVYYGNWVVVQAGGLDIFAAPGTSTLYAVDALSGGLVWEVALPGLISTVPAFADGLVVFGYSNSANLSALDYLTGAWAWNYTTNAPVSSPGVAYSGGDFFFGTSLGGVYAVSSTGKKVWEYAAGATNQIDTTPAVADATVFAGTSTGSMLALNASTGARLWKAHLGSADDVSAVVATNGLVYTGTSGGEVAALDVSNGTVDWTYNMTAGVNDGLVLAPGLLIASAADGQVVEL